jgi:hypothetical protein
VAKSTSTDLRKSERKLARAVQKAVDRITDRANAVDQVLKADAFRERFRDAIAGHETIVATSGRDSIVGIARDVLRRMGVDTTDVVLELAPRPGSGLATVTATVPANLHALAREIATGRRQNGGRAVAA